MLARSPRTLRVAALVALALAATGCGDGSVAAPASPSPAPTSTPPPAAAPIAVDLLPGGGAVTLDNGWVVQHCEGDAPFICVYDGDGETRGMLELLSFPGGDELAQAVTDGTELELLEDLVAEQHETIAADRALGCGEAYAYRAEPPIRTTLGGAPAVVYGASGVVDGREVERHRAYYAAHEGQLWILNAPASDPEGCMGTDLLEFTPADLATFEPYLARIAAGTALPGASAAG